MTLSSMLSTGDEGRGEYNILWDLHDLFTSYGLDEVP